ncbi:MAG: cytochrome c oxidase subunit 3, partial [Luteolibacter sp.]
MHQETTTPPPSSLLYPPGGLLIWSLVLMELLTFGLALTAFVISGRSEPQVFHAGRQHLQPFFGLTNTVFLLTSGYFMAGAVERFKRGTNARPFIHAAMVGGVLFLVLKSIEYHGKIEAGLTLGHDTFFTYYWLLTVFHMMHVIVGLIIL